MNASVDDHARSNLSESDLADAQDGAVEMNESGDGESVEALTEVIRHSPPADDADFGEDIVSTASLSAGTGVGLDHTMPEGSSPDISELLDGVEDPVEESPIQTVDRPPADQTLVEVGEEDDLDYEEVLEDSIDGGEDETVIEVANIAELDISADDGESPRALASRSESELRDETLADTSDDPTLLSELESSDSSSTADSEFELDEAAADDRSRRETLRSGWGQTGTQSKLIIGRREPSEITSSGMRRLNLKLGTKRSIGDEPEQEKS